MQYCIMIPMGSSEAKNIQRTDYRVFFFHLKKWFANKYFFQKNLKHPELKLYIVSKQLTAGF